MVLMEEIMYWPPNIRESVWGPYYLLQIYSRVQRRLSLGLQKFVPIDNLVEGLSLTG